LIATTSYVGLVRILAAFGSDALAGYTIAIRIVIFALWPSWGLANAAATLVGQSLGAKKPDRAAASVWRACYYNLVFLGSVGLIFVLFADGLVAAFTSDPAVRPTAASGLRIISSGFVLYAFGFVLFDVVQRRRRHVDAHDHQPALLLAVRGPARSRAGPPLRHGSARRVLVDRRGVLGDGARQRRRLSARHVEASARLTDRRAPRRYGR
jgi:hypothetical protein